jgi:hypothetical protein
MFVLQSGTLSVFQLSLVRSSSQMMEGKSEEGKSEEVKSEEGIHRSRSLTQTEFDALMTQRFPFEPPEGEKEVMRLGVGSVVGEISLLTGCPR